MKTVSRVDAFTLACIDSASTTLRTLTSCSYEITVIDRGHMPRVQLRNYYDEETHWLWISL